jgi:hypothetical protein
MGSYQLVCPGSRTDPVTIKDTCSLAEFDIYRMIYTFSKLRGGLYEKDLDG